MGTPVVGFAKGNQPAPTRDFFDQLHGPLDGFSPGIHQVHLFKGRPQETCQQGRQADLWGLNMFAVDHGMPVTVQLVSNGFQDPGVTVANNADGNPGYKIQVGSVELIVNTRTRGPADLQFHRIRRGLGQP